MGSRGVIATLRTTLASRPSAHRSAARLTLLATCGARSVHVAGSSRQRRAGIDVGDGKAGVGDHRCTLPWVHVSGADHVAATHIVCPEPASPRPREPQFTPARIRYLSSQSRRRPGTWNWILGQRVGTPVRVMKLAHSPCRFLASSRQTRACSESGLPATEVYARLFASGFDTACDRGAYPLPEQCAGICDRLGLRASPRQLAEWWAAGFTPDEDVLAVFARARTSATVATLSNNGPLVHLMLCDGLSPGGTRR